MKAMTAAELMKILEKDENYQARTKEKEEEMARLQKIYAEDRKDLLAELLEIGFDVERSSELPRKYPDFTKAIPILKKHLKIGHHPKVLQDILDTLARPELYEDEELWDMLVELYYSTPSDSKIDVAAERGSKQVISLTINRLATEKRVETIKKLIQSNKDEIDEILFMKDALEELADGKHPTQKLRKKGKSKQSTNTSDLPESSDASTSNLTNEASMNFDMEDVESFLIELDSKFEFGLDVKKLVKFTSSVAIESEKSMVLNISNLGKKSKMRFQVYMDDIDAPDLCMFFDSNELSESVNDFMMGWAEARGM